MVPKWKFDGHGHKVVESKEHMQERGIPSPDGMATVNLCIWEAADDTPVVHVEPPRAPLRPHDGGAQYRRPMSARH